MRASSINLNSDGGSILEALKIANIIEKSGLIATVENGDTCASACFLLLVSAQFRWVSDDAVVLIHRPYLPAARTDVDGYSKDLKSQQKATAAMRNFLEERSISSSIVDKMMNFPSNDAHQLTLDEMRSDVRNLSPTLEELTIDSCGLSNRNIFSAGRVFKGPDHKDDITCIRNFLMSLKGSFTMSLIGKERYTSVLESLRPDRKP